MRCLCLQRLDIILQHCMASYSYGMFPVIQNGPGMASIFHISSVATMMMYTVNSFCGWFVLPVRRIE